MIIEETTEGSETEEITKLDKQNDEIKWDDFKEDVCMAHMAVEIDLGIIMKNSFLISENPFA